MIFLLTNGKPKAHYNCPSSWPKEVVAMGAWSPGLFADDDAADLRGDYRTYMADAGACVDPMAHGPSRSARQVGLPDHNRRRDRPRKMGGFAGSQQAGGCPCQAARDDPVAAPASEADAQAIAGAIARLGV